MFTFRRFTLIFFLTLLSLNLWNIFIVKSPATFIPAHASLLYLLLFSCYIGVSVAMAFLPCTGFHLPVICCGNTNEKVIAVTFDDGPNPLKTPLILDVLKKHKVAATFFFIGNKLSGNELILKRVSEEGHLLGNHSFSHSNWFDLFSPGRMKAELMKTNKIIFDTTGKSPLFFRPPFGVVNPMVRKAVINTPWQVICWNIRSLDTLQRDPEKVRKKVLQQLKAGSIILLHDHTHFTEHHLDGLLTAIKDAGYGIVPLDSLIQKPAYAL
jgi:peptidoglycan-N-acetylglucosamine deacetylase